MFCEVPEEGKKMLAGLREERMIVAGRQEKGRMKEQGKAHDEKAIRCQTGYRSTWADALGSTTNARLEPPKKEEDMDAAGAERVGGGRDGRK